MTDIALYKRIICEQDRKTDSISLLAGHYLYSLLGKNWERYERFSKLTSLSNFSYIQFPHSEYPRYYQTMKVFASPVMLKGGSIPLIESMGCGAVPVASNTGFILDIVEHERNDFIFEVESSAEIVVN